MKINLPKSSDPVIRVYVSMPKGSFKSELQTTESQFEFEIPEGVDPDDVGITYEFLGNGRKVTDSGVIKSPRPKPEVKIEEPKPEPATIPIEENSHPANGFKSKVDELAKVVIENSGIDGDKDKRDAALKDIAEASFPQKEEPTPEPTPPAPEPVKEEPAAPHADEPGPKGAKGKHGR